MKNEIDEYKHYILKTLAVLLKLSTYVLIFLATVFCINLIFHYLSPFIFAILISFLIKPIARFFQSMKIGKGFSVAISIILVYGGLISLLSLALTRGISELVDLAYKLPIYSNDVYNFFSNLSKEAQNLYFQLPKEVTVYATDVAGNLLDKLGTLLTNTAKSAVNALYALPGFAILFLITTVATFFFSKDSEKIGDFLYRQFPSVWKNKLVNFKSNLLNALLGFLKAQLIIISITFMESLIGLNIIGIKYAFIISVLVSMVDILPILGTGSVYVPWGITSIIIGRYTLGISLLVLYGIIVVVRYMVEPKVMGQQLGIHPLIALMSMYVGIKLMGVGGVILGPTAVVTIKASQNAGILPRFK